jgi:probable rRNA maturation factor
VTASNAAAHVTVSHESAEPCDTDALARLAAFLFNALRLHPDCELGITLVDPDRMSTLHEDWMHEPGPTDVLSFPIDELTTAPAGVDPEAGILGDIVLCPGFIGPQAKAAGRSIDEELQFLVAHGTLHLIGWDHQSPEEYEAMFARQDDLLREWWGSQA